MLAREHLINSSWSSACQSRDQSLLLFCSHNWFGCFMVTCTELSIPPRACTISIQLQIVQGKDIVRESAVSPIPTFSFCFSVVLLSCNSGIGQYQPDQCGSSFFILVEKVLGEGFSSRRVLSDLCQLLLPNAKNAVFGKISPDSFWLTLSSASYLRIVYSDWLSKCLSTFFLMNIPLLVLKCFQCVWICTAWEDIVLSVGVLRAFRKHVRFSEAITAYKSMQALSCWRKTKLSGCLNSLCFCCHGTAQNHPS